MKAKDESPKALRGRRAALALVFFVFASPAWAQKKPKPALKEKAAGPPWKGSPAPLPIMWKAAGPVARSSGSSHLSSGIAGRLGPRRGRRVQAAGA